MPTSIHDSATVKALFKLKLNEFQFSLYVIFSKNHYSKAHFALCIHFSSIWCRIKKIHEQKEHA